MKCNCFGANVKNVVLPYAHALQRVYTLICLLLALFGRIYLTINLLSNVIESFALALFCHSNCHYYSTGWIAKSLHRKEKS